MKIVSFGGSSWNGRIGEGETFPYRTGAKCPSSIHCLGADGSWAENVRSARADHMIKPRMRMLRTGPLN